VSSIAIAPLGSPRRAPFFEPEYTIELDRLIIEP
jgi:hypothetical protein